VNGFLRRRNGLGQELRGARPRPTEPLVRSIESRIEAARPRPRRRLMRFAPAVAFTAVLVGAIAATGGIGYAAAGVQQVANSVSNVLVARSHRHRARKARHLSSGHDQYKPGYGWGDPNHTHTGPPGLHRHGRKHLVAHRHGRFATVNTRFSVDEQAHLYISVTTGRGKSAKRLLISQKHSRVGQGVKGRPTKNLSYLMLIPRTMGLKLAIPKGLLSHGHRYYISITARAPNGRRAHLFIPFTG
jgi:hypothetical protein